MPLTIGLVALALLFRQSHYRELETDLKSALKAVPYGSKQYTETVDRIVAKYQKGVKKDYLGVIMLPRYGPTAVSVAHEVLETNADNSDDSFDLVDIAFWPTQSGTAVQFLDGWSENQDNYPSCLVGEEYRDGDQLIRCGVATRAGDRSWPGARIYRLQKARWIIVANEEIEQPFGSAKFLRINGQVAGNAIVSHTRDKPKNFSSPMAGPLLNFSQLWYIRRDRFVLGKVTLDHNAFAELDYLAGLVRAGKRKTFDKRVPMAISQTLWEALGQDLHVSSDTDQGEAGNAFLLEERTEGFDYIVKGRLVFEKRHGVWRAARLTKKLVILKG